MDYYFGLAQTIGIHTLLGLSAYCVLIAGQVSLAQAGFFAVGAYSAGMLTVLGGLHILPALAVAAGIGAVVAGAVGFPALRVKGLMLVVATLAFGETVRLFFFIFSLGSMKDGVQIGPSGAEGFRQIRYFAENGWSVGAVAILVWAITAAVLLGLWALDRSRTGRVLRAVGRDEVAAQNVGVDITAVKVGAMALGGAIAAIGGGLYAHTTTHIEHSQFGVALAAFAIAYPILGGLSSPFGSLYAAVLIQGVMIEGFRFLGDWRSLLFGLIIILFMNLRHAPGVAIRYRALVRKVRGDHWVKRDAQC
ncbi:branched-chain amino acid ABC transporter permease [Azospirillum doebereinerae]